MMTRYVRDNNDAPIGTIVADGVNGKIHVGWAWTSKNDHPSKKMGKTIAYNRLVPVDVAIMNLLADTQKGYLTKHITDIKGYRKSMRLSDVIAAEIFSMAVTAQKQLLPVT